MGVPVGVEWALLPPRDFLADDLGVMLLFARDCTGVAVSPFASLDSDVSSVLSGRLEVGVKVEVAVAANRGVRGVFALRVEARVGLRGAWAWLCLSPYIFGSVPYAITRQVDSAAGVGGIVDVALS